MCGQKVQMNFKECDRKSTEEWKEGDQLLTVGIGFQALTGSDFHEVRRVAANGLELEGKKSALSRRQKISNLLPMVS